MIHLLPWIRPTAAAFASLTLALSLTSVLGCSSDSVQRLRAPAQATADTALAYDVVIFGGTVYGSLDENGSPVPARRIDVALHDGRIAEVGDLEVARAKHTIDATGLVVAPGFIDTHSHTAEALSSPDRSAAEVLLRQGITTVVIHPDGQGPVDLAAQRLALLADGLGVNVAQMIGHSAVRIAVLGYDDRAPSAAELQQMKALVREAFEQGAVGLSSGPFYAPGSYAQTDELVALAEVAAAYAGVYQSHIRDESNYSVGLLAAVAEVVEIAERSGATGVVTHIKALGPPVWGRSREVVDLIEAARGRGVAVWADQYPYPASATGLAAALVPRWAQAGGNSRMIDRLRSTVEQEAIFREMAANLERRGGASRIQFRYYAPDPSIEGRLLSEVAAERGLDAVPCAAELIAQAPAGDVGIVSFNMQDEDVERFMRQPWVMTASDGSNPEWGRGVPHPRGFGTFPRVIAEYVRERGVLSLEQAIDRATRLPAQVYGLRDRGVIAVGAIADLVVFDLETMQDRATFEEPFQLAEGVVNVLVGGEATLHGGELTKKNAGRVLRASSRFGGMDRGTGERR